MKDLIKQIEGLKKESAFSPIGDNPLPYYNRAINDVLAILQSLPEPIRAKAWHKKGTDEYYHSEYEVWWTSALPMLLSKEATEEEWNLMVENGNALPLPPDAELVSLEIYVKPE